jgi:hypothetical protein
MTDHGRWDRSQYDDDDRYGNGPGRYPDDRSDSESQGRRGGQYRPGERYGSSPGVDRGRKSEWPSMPRRGQDGESMPDGYREFRGGEEYFRDGEGLTGGFGQYPNQTREYRGSLSLSEQNRRRFVGKGPRGYQRSDDRINEDVCEALTQHPSVDATNVTVQVRGGEVTLTGTVNDRQAKREAEDAVEGVAGVRDVHNQLRVADGSAQSESATRKGEGPAKSERGKAKSGAGSGS